MFAGARQTAAVAVFAVVAGVLSGGYNDNYGSDDYFVRLVVVIAGATFAVLAARSRRALADDRHRFGLLRGAAQIADTAVEIPEVVDRVGALLVPAFADICVIDVLRGGAVERLGVVAHGARGGADRGAPARARPVDGRGDPRRAPAARRARRRSAPAPQRARRGGLRVPALAARALAHQRAAALAWAQRRHAGAAGDLAPVRGERPPARDPARRADRPRARQRRPVRRAESLQAG